MLDSQRFRSADEYTRRLGKRARRAQAEDVIALYWQRDDVPRFVPRKTCNDALLVEVNHGAWIVQCECGGATLASKHDRRHFCVYCLNEPFGGAWRPVIWPRDPEAIEDMLRVRLTENASWRPGETLEDLRNENAEYLGGVGV